MKRLSIPLAALFASFAFFLLSSMLPVNATNELFPDVENPELREAVLSLADQSILQGYPDGSFQGERIINRAEALKIAYASQGAAFRDPKWPESAFQDVEANTWFSPYVQAGKRDQIIKGYADGTYRPFQEVSRAEFLKIAFLADTQYRPPSISEQLESAQVLSDLSVTDWFLPFVSLVQQQSLLSLEANFNPHEGMTRADAALILFRKQQGYEEQLTKQKAQQEGCEMCVYGTDFSQYVWAHWDAVDIAHHKISIGSRKNLEVDFGKKEIGIPYLENLAHEQQFIWILKNTPAEEKWAFDKKFPEYYQRAIGLSGGYTGLDFGYRSKMGGNVILASDGLILNAEGVDHSFEKHLRFIFGYRNKDLNPAGLNFHVWKMTDKGKEGMYDALVHMQWYSDESIF